MNQHDLSKLYDHLQPHERVALIVAAAGRDDGAEADRLVRSSPWTAWKLPTYWGLAQGLIGLASEYVMRQLAIAILFWRVQGWLDLHAACCPGADGPHGSREQFNRLLRLTAYLLTVRAEAFQRLTAELPTDPHTLLGALPGVDSLRQAVEAARGLAFSEQEAIAFLRDQGEEQGRLLTVETLVSAMRACLDRSQDYWS
jgi:hypothetical protein